MKISNETKVGALTAIAITLLVLGFNFLKGRSLVKTGNFLYASFTDVKELKPSNPVYINGFQVGMVYDIENTDASLRNITVTIKFNTAYNIPANSYATIASSPLGSPTVQIILGDSAKLLANGSNIKTKETPGLFASLTNQLSPVAGEVKKAVLALEIVLKNINATLDPNTKNNLQQVIANLNKTTANLATSSASLNTMLDKESGSITQTMNNVNSFTKNLDNNNEKINAVVSNLENTTKKLSEADIQGTVTALKSSIKDLSNVLQKMENGDGTMGKLMNDKALYDNLSKTVRSANTLLDDLRVNPKRYVNISVFGKKDKKGPLMNPLSDSVTKR